MNVNVATSDRDVEGPRPVAWQRRRAATTMTMPERERFDEGRHQGVEEARRAVADLLILTARPDRDELELEVVARAAEAGLQRLTEGSR